MSAERQRVFWAMVAVTALAAVMRWLGLLTLPPQAWVDEIWFALRAREIVQTGELPLFYKTFWGGVNPMLAWLTAAVQGLAMPGLIVSSRVVSATFSLLAVPLAYVCLNELWREEMPAARRRPLTALAALVLAGFFSTVTLTRLGTEPGVALAAGLFCLWQLRRAIRTGLWRSYALAGLAAGWAQYVSPHARFIPIVMALWGLHALFRAQGVRRARLWPGFALIAGSAILVALPLIRFFAREPEWFLGRARAVTVGAQVSPADFLLENARVIALSFSLMGDANARDNLAGRPLLDPIQSIGFYLGLAGALWSLRRSAAARDLLLWLAVMIAPSLVTDNAPSFSRMIHVAAPAAGLIALGWALARDWGRARLAARPAAAITILAVAASLTINAWDYFGRFAAQPGLAAAYTATPVRLAQDLIRRSASEAVFVETITEADEDIYAFDFLFPGTGVDRPDFRQCLPLADGRAARTTYLIWSERDAVTAPQLRRAFPDAAVTVIRPEAESLVAELTLVEAPAGARAVLPGRPAQARFAPGLSLLGVEQTPDVARPGESVLLTLYWRVDGAVPANLVAFTHLGTGLSASRNIAQRDGAPCQGQYPPGRWRVGDVVPDRFAVVIPPDAPPGDYPIAVGWYRYPSLERLPLESAGQPLPDNRAVVGTVSVVRP